MYRELAVAATACLAVGACSATGTTVAGTPVVQSTPASSSTSVGTTAPATIPTATQPDDPVKGTTFDACTTISDADVATWEVDPASKRSSRDTMSGANVRGCVWDGPKWQIRVYAVDGSLSYWEEPDPYSDRQERIQIGSRSGWLLHDKDGMGCSAAIPSQQAIAAVQVDLNYDLTKQRYDQCPLAVRIMTQIEPKIP